MPQLTYEDKVIEIEEVSGTVLSHEVRSSTTVRSTGGGGVINNGSGVLLSTRTVSSTEHWSDFWILDNVGKEIRIRIDQDLGLREGQRITLLRIRAADNSYRNVALYNHNADSYYEFINARNLADMCDFGQKKTLRYIIPKCLGVIVLVFLASNFVPHPMQFVSKAGEWTPVPWAYIVISAIVRKKLSLSKAVPTVQMQLDEFERQVRATSSNHQVRAK